MTAPTPKADDTEAGLEVACHSSDVSHRALAQRLMASHAVGSPPPWRSRTTSEAAPASIADSWSGARGPPAPCIRSATRVTRASPSSLANPYWCPSPPRAPTPPSTRNPGHRPATEDTSRSPPVCMAAPQRASPGFSRRTILDRLPHLAFAGGEIARRPGTFHSGLTALPVTFQPVALTSER